MCMWCHRASRPALLQSMPNDVDCSKGPLQRCRPRCNRACSEHRAMPESMARVSGCPHQGRACSLTSGGTATEHAPGIAKALLPSMLHSLLSELLPCAGLWDLATLVDCRRCFHLRHILGNATEHATAIVSCLTHVSLDLGNATEHATHCYCHCYRA